MVGLIVFIVMGIVVHWLVMNWFIVRWLMVDWFVVCRLMVDRISWLIVWFGVGSRRYRVQH